MKNRFQFSIGKLLAACVFISLALTIVVQHTRHLKAEIRLEREMALLRERLYVAELAATQLPVDDPTHAYLLAEPAYAYGRWKWRVYLPHGSRYAVHIHVGAADDDGRITSSSGHDQSFGVRGNGLTTFLVEQFDSNRSPLIGVSVGKFSAVCRLTPEVDRCFATRLSHREEQLGDSGVVDVQPNESIELLRRWYPVPGPDHVSPVGVQIRLEPLGEPTEFNSGSDDSH